MKQSLARVLSVSTAGKFCPSIFHSKNKLNPHYISPVIFPFSSFKSSGRLFSSETSSKPPDSILEQSQTKYEPSDAEKNSNAELKKQIEKMYDGDEDAFISVFEAILQRKLDGTSDELDKELINELPNTSRAYDSEDDKELESESDSD